MAAGSSCRCLACGSSDRVRFIETPIPGAWIVDVERHADARGFFARTYDAEAFRRQGLRTSFPQCSVSFNEQAGTVRGMHLQAAPHEEAKLVRCTAGAIWDVLVDLRPSSPAYCRSHAVELTHESRRALYIPEGVAHGFQTLTDATEVLYMISAEYAPEASRGYRWDDPAFGIEWPATATRIMSDRDRTFPAFDRAAP